MAEGREGFPGSFRLQVEGERRSVGAVGSGERGGVRAGDPADAAGLGPFADLVSTTLLDDVEVRTTRAAGERQELVGVEPDQVLELELEGGFPWFTTAEGLVELLADADARREAPPDGSRTRGAGEDGEAGFLSDGVVRVPSALPFGTPTRGGGQLVLRVLRRFGVDLPEMGAQALAAKLEDRLEPGPGLYRCPNFRRLGSRVESTADVPGGAGALLVFLHGTASTTGGSFGDLDGSIDWARTAAGYGDRILSFQHRTLSESPVRNALELAKLLPAEAPLQMVSHSRGGLVGEILCRAAFVDRDPFTDGELDAFAGDDRRADREDLAELNRLLKEKRLRVERFVRVACPARGTILASKRLDRYLSLMLGALGLAVGDRLNPAYQFLKSLVIALVRKRADPESLPGLEAMMPGSPLVAVLNGGDGMVDGDLTVVAGDVEGQGVLGRLKIFATDLFYRRDHDLVVDSRAMFGGARRTEGRARYYFERGVGTTHFNYFQNPGSSALLARALSTAGNRVEGFQPLRVGRPPAGVRGLAMPGLVPKDRLAGLSPDRPVVVVLPGIMGSRLRAGGNVVWLDKSDLFKGRLEDLRVRFDEGGNLLDDGVEPAGLMEGSYGDLVGYLVASHEVVAFDYDWRRPVDEAAERLGDVLAEIAERTERPVRLLAHSMGGLVVRRTRALRGDLWQRLRERSGFRFVMLGTPNGGSHSIAQILLGRGRELRLLGLLDVRHGKGRVLEWVGNFPGLYDLLAPGSIMPDRAAQRDLHDKATWDGWREYHEGDVLDVPERRLAGAGSFRDALDSEEPFTPGEVLYVAGQGRRGTPFAVWVAKDFFGRDRVKVALTPFGDGRVLWETGLPPGLEGKAVEMGAETGRPQGQVGVWYAPGVSHGALAGETRIFPALLDLLQHGSTRRLPTEAPRSRGGEETILLDVDEPLLYPDDEDLEAELLGAEPSLGAPVRSLPELRVTVAHGSLSYARGPALVGHYERDVIASAEEYLDRMLDGALSELLRLGLYPGPEGTAEVVLDREDPERGALVVGLGGVGKLAPGKITTGVQRAVLRYARRVADLEKWPGETEGERRVLHLTSLLVGAGEGTGLTVEDSLLAVIRGVARAASTLSGSDQPELKAVVVGELQFLELYEHRAVCACRALRSLAARPELVAPDVPLFLDPVMQSVEGGQRDIPCTDAGWWQRLQICEDAPRDGCEGEWGEAFQDLVFTSLTDRARAEVRLQATQRSLVEELVQRSIASGAWDPSRAQTLFELLIPHELKDYAPDERRLLLVLDRGAAVHPWELLADRLGSRRPLSVRSGMLRQLQTTGYRRNPVLHVGSDALVIGDPPTGDPSYPELPGARREADAVALALWDQGWNVVPKIQAPPEEVVNALFQGDYRILHVAAHGDYPVDCPRASGVILGRGMRITPAELGQLRRVPELVFMNCCHLGRLADRSRDLPGGALRWSNRLAATVGTELIDLGVRAVVVAGWAVDDDAAEVFADTFYRALLEGDTYGDAVVAAREATWQRYPETNTWGAYQCYGDPAFRLRPARDGGRRRRPSFVAPVQAVHELENLTGRARTGSRPEKLQEELDALEDYLSADHPTWLGRSDVRERLGDAWRELAKLAAADLDARVEGPGGGDHPLAAFLEERERTLRPYRRAVEHYRAALVCHDLLVTLDVRGTVVNLDVRAEVAGWRALERYARRRLARPELSAAEAEAIRAELDQARTRAIDRAKEAVDKLLEYARHPTVERWSLVGSARRRLAALLEGGERTRMVNEAVDAYGTAHELAREVTGRIHTYPAGNWALLKVVARLADGRRSWQGVEEVLEAMEGGVRARSFWDRVATADAALVRQLMEVYEPSPEDPEGREQPLDQVVDLYGQALQKGRSRIQEASILEHLEGLADVLDDRWGPDLAAVAAQRIAEARRRVVRVRDDLRTRERDGEPS